MKIRERINHSPTAAMAVAFMAVVLIATIGVFSTMSYADTKATRVKTGQVEIVAADPAQQVETDPAEQVKSEVSEIFKTLQDLREEIDKVTGRLEGQENVSIEQQNTDASVLALEVAGLRESIDEEARLPVASSPSLRTVLR